MSAGPPRRCERPPRPAPVEHRFVAVNPVRPRSGPAGARFRSRRLRLRFRFIAVLVTC